MAVIEVEGLRKRYGDVVAVDDVSFTVEEGEVFGLLGPNGAGKTTTVECIEGLRSPDAGRVSVLGLDPRRDRAGIRQVVGAQLQESRLPDKLRVGEAARLDEAVLTGIPEVDGVSRRGGETVVVGHGNLLDTVTRALVHEGVTPEHLLVDQPTLEDAYVALTGRQEVPA